MLQASGYLVLRRSGWRLSARWLKTKPTSTTPNEVVVHLSVEVPDALFERPQLTAVLTVDRSKVPSAEIEEKVLISAAQILEAQTGLRVEFVKEEPIERIVPPLPETVDEPHQDEPYVDPDDMPGGAHDPDRGR